MEIYSEIDNLINLINNSTDINKDLFVNNSTYLNDNLYINTKYLCYYDILYICLSICNILLKYKTSLIDIEKFNKIYDKIKLIMKNSIIYDLETCFELNIDTDIINKYNEYDLTEEFFRYLDNYLYDNYRDGEFINNIFLRILYIKDWNVLSNIINSKYFENKNNYYEDPLINIIFILFCKYIIFLPDDILDKFLTKFLNYKEGYVIHLTTEMIIIYYLHYKLINSKYIPFEKYIKNS